jgi:hypothetical protein
MGLIDQIREDVKQIVSDANGFAVPATFVAPTSETIDINVLFSKHHTSLDTDGRKVSSRNASLSLAESLMVGYPVRDNTGEVNLKRHIVTVADSTGVDKTYEIINWYPDETLGLIVCILGDYE